MEAFAIWDELTNDWWAFEPGPYHNRASAEDAVRRHYEMESTRPISDLSLVIRTLRLIPEPVEVGL